MSSPIASRVPHLLVAATVIILVLLGPLAGSASAHVALIKSTPSYNEELTSAPTEVSLTFDGRIESSLANAVLETGGPVGDPTGVIGDLTRTTGPGATDTVAFSLPVRELDPGQYRVSWTVYAFDGHTMTGVVPFTVTGRAGPDETSATTPVTPTPDAPGEAPERSGPDEEVPEDTQVPSRARNGGSQGGSAVLRALKVLVKTTLYAALTLLAGALFWLWAPVHPKFTRPLRSRVAKIGAGALIATAVSAGALAALGVANALAAGIRDSRALALVASGNQVWPWLLVAVLSGAASGRVRSGRIDESTPSSGGRWGSVAALVLAAVVLAASGHTSDTRWPLLSMLFLAVHVLAVVAWAGPVAMMGALRFTRVGRHRHFVRAVVPALVRFTPVAVTAVVALMISGLRVMWSIGDRSLPGGSYGWLLASKSLALAVGAGPWGLFHMLAVRRASRGGRSSRFAATLALELGGIAVALALAAFLSGTSPG